jgi:hypothetical protein
MEDAALLGASCSGANSTVNTLPGPNPDGTTISLILPEASLEYIEMQVLHFGVARNHRSERALMRYLRHTE